MLLENTRTPGTAGCLNTGVLYVLAHVDAPETCCIAFTNEQVDWRPSHLERCLDSLQDNDVVVVDATDGLSNKHSDDWTGVCVRLDMLLMAGMFDEDRAEPDLYDLLHRLESIGARVAVIGDVRDGMYDEVQRESGRTSLSPSEHGRICPSESVEPKATTPRPPPPPSIRAYKLYVGIITGDASTIARLLEDLDALRSQSFLADLVAVVLRNGCPPSDLDAVLHRMRQRGMRCALVTEADQRRDTERGAFGLYRHRAEGRVGIAQARTMLQRYLAQILIEDAGSFAWILDDDMRVDDRAGDYLPWLPVFRHQGVDALIGAHEGSSPNPPLNGLRVQLVDLWRNLEWLRSLDPTSAIPDRSSANRLQRKKYPDYYYDLSRKHTGHQESVHWITPAHEGETAREAFDRVARSALGLLSGMPLTRPVLVDMPANPIEDALDSVNRGGNTLILQPRTIAETPNITLTVDGEEARRSDMVWAIINRYYRGRTIKRVNFPIVHLGRPSSDPKLDIHKVTGEIVGSAFYGAFTDFLEEQDRHDLVFSLREIETVSAGISGHAERRLRDLSLSFWRIRGLSRALTRYAGHGTLGPMLDYLHDWIAPAMFEAIADGVRAAGREEFERFLTTLKEATDAYEASTADVSFIRSQLGEPLIEG